MKLSQGQKSHSCQIAVKPLYFADSEAKKKPPKHSENGLSKRFLNGARDGTRTHDLLITNQLRYQLRHSSGYSVCFVRFCLLKSTVGERSERFGLIFRVRIVRALRPSLFGTAAPARLLEIATHDYILLCARFQVVFTIESNNAVWGLFFTACYLCMSSREAATALMP